MHTGKLWQAKTTKGRSYQKVPTVPRTETVGDGGKEDVHPRRCVCRGGGGDGGGGGGGEIPRDEIPIYQGKQPYVNRVMTYSSCLPWPVTLYL